MNTEQKWKLFFPDRELLERKGYFEIAGCPAVFYGDTYAKLPSLYLRERGAGNWHHDVSGDETEGGVLSPNSQRNCGYKLLNFLKYCSAAKINPLSMEYKHALRYQTDMVTGRWAFKNRALSPSTANDRTDEACSYLAWLAHRGYRRPFMIETRRLRARYRGRGRYKLIVVRARRAKVRPSGSEVLNLPTDVMVQDWLASVRRRRGESKMLNCRLILETGLRLHEACKILVDQWPSLTDIDLAMKQRYSSVNLAVSVTKGGQPRVVKMNSDFAKLVALWIHQRRPLLADIYVKRTRGKTPPNLFLSDARGYEGTPISTNSVFECFKAPACDFSPWYPHHGRHYWTCTFILKGLRRDAAANKQTLKGAPSNWVQTRVDYWVNLARLQLGHISEKTTEIYMRWIMTQIELIDVSDEWSDFLETEDA